MSQRTIIVIGGVAAGAGAATKARREDEHARILLFERGPHISFANCGLPYFVGGEIAERDALLVQTPQSLASRFNLEVHVDHEVKQLLPEQREVVVVDRATGVERRERWDALVLATGSRPIVPPLPGMKSLNVSLLRTVPEAEQLRQQVDSGQVRRAVVVGGGFIGLEAAENLRHRGVAVTLVEKADQVMTPLDREMTTPLLEELGRLGVRVVLGQGVQGFVTEGERATAARLESGELLEADLFLLSIGVRPEVELARQAGIALGPTGGIAVDEYMATNLPGVYAAGDAVEILHRVSGKRTWIPLAGPANKQGRVAGANAAGRRMTFRGAWGTSIVRVGKVVAAKTGLSEKECAQHGLACRVTYNHHGDHAGYYPGAQNLSLKLLSERDSGRLLGAQIIGGQGVDKRIDVLATAIYGSMTVEDLENLDLAYAPPFNSAKDPVVMAGMNHANAWRGQARSWTPAEAAGPLGSGRLQVVDVREPRELAEGTLPGAVNIPLPQLRARLAELDPSKETLVYCRSGQRSYFASRILSQRGFERVVSLGGGWLAWQLQQGASPGSR